MFDKILTARQQRRDIIESLIHTYDLATVKANLPGEDKNIPESRLLVSYFTSRCAELGMSDIKTHKGDDGVWTVGAVDFAQAFKDYALMLEETDSVGRLIDIDVYPMHENRSLSRPSMRKCYICELPAFVCGRMGNHSKDELRSFFATRVRTFFKEKLTDIVYSSLMCELNLENKFGLVSPTSSGSHTDLNYENMKSAAQSISPYIADCFFLGLSSDNSTSLLPKLRPVGIMAEKMMQQQTGGANAYKGFIFIGGVLCAAVGYAVANGKRYGDVYKICAEICKDMAETSPSDTFGYRAFSDFGFGGIRAHALGGFLGVRDAEAELDEALDNLSLIKALTYIVGITDDSVLLKRAGNFEKYTYFKNAISNVDILDKDALLSLNEKCVEENISIGGSADVLISAVMMRKIKELLFYEDRIFQKE